jgi:hypothetical protein
MVIWYICQDKSGNPAANRVCVRRPESQLKSGALNCLTLIFITFRFQLIISPMKYLALGICMYDRGIIKTTSAPRVT